MYYKYSLYPLRSKVDMEPPMQLTACVFEETWKKTVALFKPVVTKTQDGTEPSRDVPSCPALLKPGTAGRDSELDCMLNHGTHLKLAEYMYAHVAMPAP